jgi:hypothetical protein
MTQSTLSAEAPAPRPPHDALALAPPIPDGPWSLVETLLKTPRSILEAARDGTQMHLRLVAMAVASWAVAGVVMALFSGGAQLVYVPVKIVVGIIVGSLLCLPSLHIFSCLSGAEQRVKDTLAALLMGVALMGVLLVGFAPIGWIFSQATSSVPAMGAVHLVFLLLSTWLGTRLMRRSLSAMNRQPVRGTRLWTAMFVLVILQMTTTMRPLIGPADGVLLHRRLFFVSHWIESAR